MKTELAIIAVTSFFEHKVICKIIVIYYLTYHLMHYQLTIQSSPLLIWLKANNLSIPITGVTCHQSHSLSQSLRSTAKRLYQDFAKELLLIPHSLPLKGNLFSLRSSERAGKITFNNIIF